MTRSLAHSAGSAIGAATLLAIGPGAAHAGVWTLEPALSASTEYSTNAQLRLDHAESGGAAVANIGLPSDWDDGARHFELAPRARVAATGGDSAIGANAYYLRASADVRAERSEFASSAGWADDSSAVREPVAGTLIRTEVRQRTLDANASWNHSLGPRFESAWSVGWQSVAFGIAPGAGLFDYRYTTASGQLNSALSERTQVQLIATAGQYQLPASDYQDHSYSLQGGWVGRLSASWSYKLLLGRSQLSSSASAQHPVGTIYLASLERDGLRSSLSASLKRSIQPSGFGTLAETREANGRFSWQQTERSTYSVTLRSVTSIDSFHTLTLADRSYVAAAIGGSWRASFTWSIGAEVNWQQTGIAASPMAASASGHGLGFLVTASRQFGRVRLT